MLPTRATMMHHSYLLTHIKIAQDNLGSSTSVTNSAGALVVNESFAAYGARRGNTGWTGNPTSGDYTNIANTTRRGYTGHTMLDNLNLIHMNGRMYDPMIGRFVSADPFVDAGLASQGLNRYSYVGNNPLSRVDPSGYDGSIGVVHIHPIDPYARPPEPPPGGGAPMGGVTVSAHQQSDHVFISAIDPSVHWSTLMPNQNNDRSIGGNDPPSPPPPEQEELPPKPVDPAPDGAGVLGQDAIDKANDWSRDDKEAADALLDRDMIKYQDALDRAMRDKGRYDAAMDRYNASLGYPAAPPAAPPGDS